jgi:hypothetical protein
MGRVPPSVTVATGTEREGAAVSRAERAVGVGPGVRKGAEARWQDDFDTA